MLAAPSGGGLGWGGEFLLVHTAGTFACRYGQNKRRQANVSTQSDGIGRWGGEKAVCAYSRVKGPTWRGARSLGEEQELVVNMEDGEEEYGEEDAEEESLPSVKTLEMATSTMP